MWEGTRVVGGSACGRKHGGGTRKRCGTTAKRRKAKIFNIPTVMWSKSMKLRARKIKRAKCSWSHMMYLLLLSDDLMWQCNRSWAPRWAQWRRSEAKARVFLCSGPGGPIWSGQGGTQRRTRSEPPKLIQHAHGYIHWFCCEHSCRHIGVMTKYITIQIRLVWSGSVVISC